MTLALGLGCETGADASEVISLAIRVLDAAGLDAKALSGVFSIDMKRDEPAIHAAARHFGVPAVFFTSAQLEAQTPRLKNPSQRVFELVGCHGVAEAAALRGAGAGSELIVEKTRSANATAAVAKGTEG